MRVPLTVADFLARGETGFAESVAVVDESAQPAPPVPALTYRELGRRVRAWQAGLDALGVGAGSGWRWSATTAPGCSSCSMRSRPAAASACR